MKYEALKKSKSENITDIHADSDEKNLCFRVLKSLLRGYSITNSGTGAS